MTVIGLCGRSGSGKGVVSAAFLSLGVPSIDTDRVYHELTAPPQKSGGVSDCLIELTDEFGQGILAPNGGLDRRVLASIVFDNRDRLLVLDRIAHKHILGETERRLNCLRLKGYREVIVDAPLLFESGYDRRCDFIIAADAPEETLVRRITARDGISAEEAIKRLSSQLTSEELRQRADFVIYTDVEIEAVDKRAGEILEAIRKESGLAHEH